ncbi:MAG: alpha/beta hydrolase, partial [Bdellovibrionales bacterium]|nr:alpha/beta hydrolase [Bdellovibrionales bacterium]
MAVRLWKRRFQWWYNTWAFSPDKRFPFKSTPQASLALQVFHPPNFNDAMRYPAIVFFFGGSWVHHSLRQFFPMARYFADRGFVSICVDYRTLMRDGTSPTTAMADGLDALIWINNNLETLNIDRNQIIFTGASVGGHMAASFLLPYFRSRGYTETEIVYPKGLVLLNPVSDTTVTGFGSRRLGELSKDLSLVHNLPTWVPPTLILHGTSDRIVSFANSQDFMEKILAQGGTCLLVPFEDQQHGFFNYQRSNIRLYSQALKIVENFINSFSFQALVKAN